MSVNKYPKQGSLGKYFRFDVIDSVHNAIKHGNFDMKKYQFFLEPMRRKSNGHRGNIYR